MELPRFRSEVVTARFEPRTTRSPVQRSTPLGHYAPHAGLDIGYVPAGLHAFLRLSGQFGPLQLIFHWPEGPVDLILFIFLVLRMPPLFILGIGKTRKATLIRTYFFVIYLGLMFNHYTLSMYVYVNIMHILMHKFDF